ncbi:DNA double-strand break repair ATPase Rad50 [Natronobiforma cellulositropha]|uniref:DNA double-strand break repair ATPase Rad50 n=1 Tax=Natronobiforma cellulositropha TaxID=1679076 RepID=UPI0021D5AD31|nr:DNA double-strand break repair ATPase Rad50 [Natronobiforma cellulositropha]
MRVSRVRLENFKCYGESDLRLRDGVTVVYGVNGSGKSSLLEAVFFALYGSKALDDRTLDDVITTGEEETGVELWFSHDGREYHVERRLKLRGERATTTKCVLESGDETIEGARDVRREITELLRMDADAFVNCAYVRQGEVNKLIHASPRERQDMIDDLLQLGALEEYRERASDARLGVREVLNGQQELVDDVRSQVEAKEERNLHERLNARESERAKLDEKIDHYESQRREAERTAEAATTVLERHEQTQEELATLEDDIESLRETIGETERERETLEERLRTRRERRDELEDDRDEARSSVDLDGASVEERLDELEAEDETLRERLEECRLEIETSSQSLERLRERADELEREGAQAREEAADLAETLEADEETIEQREATLAELDGEIERARATFEEAPVEYGEASAHRETVDAKRTEVGSTLEELRIEIEKTSASIEEGETLLAAGKCPECGQPVEDSPHVDVLEERRAELETLETERDERTAELEAVEERLERAEELVEIEREVEQLETNRENVAQLLAEKREALTERAGQRETLLERADELEGDAEEKREEASELEETVAEHRADLGAVNRERKELSERRAALERVQDLETEIETLDGEIEAIRTQRASKAELNEERRTRLSEKRTRVRDLEAEFDAERIEEARNEKENAESYLERVGAELETLGERRDEVQNAIGAIERELEELEELRGRLEHLGARCQRLESLYEEAETLQATYGDLRAELRRKNVDTLERLLNETFDLVYQNDSYAAIELDGEYRLTVYQKDGEALEPEQLSGGERALFNLSLRCAIYRLLAEGVEGSAPMPPLILDEPTVFLDSGHVTQLVSLVESMRSIGVEQIVVVSHDQELVGAADRLVSVEKDSTSNRSRLAHGEPPEAALLSAE